MIINFEQKRKGSKNAVIQGSNCEVTGEINQGILEDIDKLSAKLGLSREESIRVAKDFYKSYPYLIEFIRSPEVFVGNSDNLLSKLIKEGK